MEYLYITCIGLLMFFSFSLLTKKQKPLSEKIFSAWIILLMLTVLSFLLYVKGVAHQYPIFITLVCDTHLLHGALLLLYVKAFTNPGFRLRTRHLWHLSPILVLVFGKLFLNFAVDEMHCYQEGGCVEEDNLFVNLTYLYKYLVLGYYIYETWKVERNYRVNAGAPREKMRASWVRQITLGVSFLFLGILLIQLGRFILPDLFWERMLLGNILTTLFIFIFLYIGNSYAYLFISPSRKRFVNLSENFNPANCRKQEVIESLQELFQKVERLMQDEEPYLKAHLTLQDIADQIGEGATHISQAINRSAGCNFNEYVNAYRVEKLKVLLQDPANWNFKIMALADDCGFSSKSSVIRIFKKETGITPGEYLQQVREKLETQTGLTFNE